MITEQTWTILKLLETTTKYFQTHQITPARLTAELLLAHALQTRRIDLYLRYDQPCSQEERDTFRQLVKRRASHEPTQYITRQVEFWSLPLYVDSRVLIPRPDTEVLVEEAHNSVRKSFPAGKGLSIVDIGTGSGAIGLALKKELPEAQITVTDCDPKALDVAKQNANTLQLPLEFLEGDLFSPLPGRSFDRIVSNPPYIPSHEIETLSKEIKEFEPRHALDGGDDGLFFIKRILVNAKAHLNPGGILFCEMALEQGEKALSLAKTEGFFAKIRKDYEGRDRVLIAGLSELKSHKIDRYDKEENLQSEQNF